MPGEDAMFEAVVLGAAMGILSVLIAGVRRIPWRYAGLIGLGYGVLFGTLRLSTESVEPWILVGLGALAGGLAVLGTERGERERARRSASILAGRSGGAQEAR
jgi:hypothetical protein